MLYVLSRLIIRDKITNPITAKIASNPGDFFEFGVGFTVGDVAPDVSVSSSLGDVDSEVDSGLAPSSTDGAGAGVGDGVGVGAGVVIDTAPVLLLPLDDLEWVVGVGVGGVDISPEVNNPLSTVTEIGLPSDDLLYSEITSIFSGLEPVPTAVNSTFAKTISPLAPPKFDADIAVNPATLLLLNAATVEFELLVTSVTCTTEGL